MRASLPAHLVLAWTLWAGPRACHVPRPVDARPAPARPTPRTSPSKNPGPGPLGGSGTSVEPADRKGASARLLGRWPRDSARVRLSGHKEPIREVLARLGQAARLNFVLADEVQGEVTTSIEAEPWLEVLGALLELKDLVAEREGDVVWVLRREDHLREQATKL